MTINCPKCGKPVDVTGAQPGSSVTCVCGNVLVVPKKGMSRTLLFVLIGAGVVVLACPCLGILSAIAIPNFIRYQARAKQSECMTNLKAFYVSARMAKEQGGDVKDLAKIGFTPERGNRYAYFLGPGPVEERGAAQATPVEGVEAIGVDTFKFPTLRPFTFKDLPPDVAAQVGVSGECPECSITVACAGDIDNNASDSPDVWSISTEERSTDQGDVIPAGQPYNHVNDVTSD
ncbi:fimbrial protein [Hyalangium versicolor]|uniref:fimbrial protein n=1 Tax=Hyalangium versicolor TaxID=2861190 RepID=UPI001CCF1D7E|nr:fimbrial protein [Hyalangium versicolor]